MVKHDKIGDKIDWHILTVLQQHGRMSNQQLAQTIHLSPSACSERVRQLEATGVIKGYQAQLNPTQLPAHIQVLAQITLRDQRRATFDRFEQHVLACEQVVACDLVSGEFDFLVRLVCPNAEQYRELTNAWLEHPTMNIARIVSHHVLQTQRHFTQWPLAAMCQPAQDRD